jgi:DNA end-binding protein Ku
MGGEPILCLDLRSTKGAAMPERPVWSGFVRFSLVTIPVKAYAAASPERGRVSFHQLCGKCHSRIKYQKVCPLHGEVPNDQIVSGYEMPDGQYIVVQPAELEKLEDQSDKTITISAFVKPEQIEPTAYAGKAHYLLPDGPVAARPYTVLHRALAEQGLYAFAQVVFHGREQPVVVRPVEGGLLALNGLLYQSEMKSPSDFLDLVPHMELATEELTAAKALAGNMEPEAFDFARYEDTHRKSLLALIESKAASKQLVSAPAAETPQVSNLMEALQRSLAAARQKQGDGAARARPPRQAAPSVKPDRRPAQAAKKRKTS